MATAIVQILDGKQVAEEIKAEVRKTVEELQRGQQVHVIGCRGSDDGSCGTGERERRGGSKSKEVAGENEKNDDSKNKYNDGNEDPYDDKDEETTSAMVSNGTRTRITDETSKTTTTEKSMRSLPPPKLAMILVGERPDSATYVRMKQKACTECGVQSMIVRLPENCTQESLEAAIGSLNSDAYVDGILVQLPLPAHIDAGRAVAAVDPRKDVDGLHPLNCGLLATRGREPLFYPCTAEGCVELCLRRGPPLAGSRVVILGRSNIVGLPAAQMFLRHDATVTICHSRSKDLPRICREADVLIAAVGQPLLVRPHWIFDDCSSNNSLKMHQHLPSSVHDDTVFAQHQPELQKNQQIHLLQQPLVIIDVGINQNPYYNNNNCTDSSTAMTDIERNSTTTLQQQNNNNTCNNESKKQLLSHSNSKVATTSLPPLDKDAYNFYRTHKIVGDVDFYGFVNKYPHFMMNQQQQFQQQMSTENQLSSPSIYSNFSSSRNSCCISSSSSNVLQDQKESNNLNQLTKPMIHSNHPATTHNSEDNASSSNSLIQMSHCRPLLITPVPGGVGPMTVAILLRNTLKSRLYKLNYIPLPDISFMQLSPTVVPYTTTDSTTTTSTKSATDYLAESSPT